MSIPNADTQHPELEKLTYDYNVRGWLLGVNRDYAKDANSSNYFGFDLGYDKANNGIVGNALYSNPQYNGNIEGMVWKSKGDAEKRKYDFTYDAANRLLSGDFNQYTSNSFNKTAGIDFSVKMGDGVNAASAYDANGNILGMKQMGLNINQSSYIDQLTYTYQPGSNKLQQVADASNDNSSKLGDFKYDPTTKTTTDYSYDANGNMTIDNNKKINGIVYNFLNLPASIPVTAKGSIDYVYDAGGNKLKKIVHETGKPDKVTTYLGGAVYEDDVLQFLPQEEGRIRYKPAAGNIAASFQYDYFIKDHLGNVRMVLTEEHQVDAYPPASMETAQATTEELLYTNLPATRVAKPSGYPTDTYTNPNNNVAKTNGNGNKIGPAIILKVMAGDKFNIRVTDWYKLNGTTPGSPVNPLNDLLSALTNSFNNIGGAHGSSGTDLYNSGILTPNAQAFLNNQTYNSSKPKAFLNWMLLDEQFKYVQGSSGAEQVGSELNLNEHTKTNMPIDKSGYLYIYVSNETPNIDVFFDNLQVTHVRGQILEETHYYPFGLVMSGISSKALNNAPANKYKFNGIEQNNDFDLNMYDAFYRNLDPQIGRFWQIDPKLEEAEIFSPYSAMGNNPILYADPLGDIVRNAHDEEVNLATGRRDAANAALNTSMTNYGVADRNISKKDFLAGGHTKDEWKDFKGARGTADRAERRLNTALSNQFEAQEDINQLQHDNPTLFNAVNTLPIDVFIGRTSDPAVRVDAGGGANVYSMNAAGDIRGRMYNLDDFFGGADQFRNGMAVWIQNGRGQYSTVLHETGHTASMYGGVPAIGIGGIPYGTAGNPANVTDYVRNYAAAWGGGCADCRTSPANCNPTSAAAVAAENLRREPAARYVRQVNPHR
jgi:RHS repeat-associated protein